MGEGHALYEPIHGSAPDIAGKDIANPIGMILSVAMMFEHSMNAPALARKIREAVSRTLEDGYRTADIWEPGTQKTGTDAFGSLIAKNM